MELENDSAYAGLDAAIALEQSEWTIHTVIMIPNTSLSLNWLWSSDLWRIDKVPVQTRWLLKLEGLRPEVFPFYAESFQSNVHFWTIRPWMVPVLFKASFEENWKTWGPAYLSPQQHGQDHGPSSASEDASMDPEKETNYRASIWFYARKVVSRPTIDWWMIWRQRKEEHCFFCQLIWKAHMIVSRTYSCIASWELVDFLMNGDHTSFIFS